MQASTGLRPCQACRLRRVKCNRSNGEGEACDQCARKNITCLEQSKRAAPTTRRNVSGRRVQEAKDLFGDTASSLPCLKPNASTSQILRLSSLDGLPISSQEVGILSRDYFDSIFQPDSQHDELASYKLRCAADGWSLSQMSALDQVIACFTASQSALLAYNIPIQLPFYPQEQQCLVRQQTARQLMYAAKTIAERAGYYSTASKDALSALAFLLCGFSDLEDTASDAMTAGSTAISHTHLLHVGTDQRPNNHLASWTVHCRYALACLKHNRKCMVPLDGLAELVGEGDREILNGNYSNTEVFAGDVGITTTAARTVRSMYMLAGHLYNEKNVHTIDTAIRRVLQQHEVIQSWLTGQTQLPAKSWMFPHCIALQMHHAVIIDSCVSILEMNGLDALQARQQRLLVAQETFRCVKAAVSFNSQYGRSTAGPALVGIGVTGMFRENYYKQMELALRSTANPYTEVLDREWLRKYYTSMALAWPEYIDRAREVTMPTQTLLSVDPNRPLQAWSSPFDQMSLYPHLTYSNVHLST